MRERQHDGLARDEGGVSARDLLLELWQFDAQHAYVHGVGQCLGPAGVSCICGLAELEARIEEYLHPLSGAADPGACAEAGAGSGRRMEAPRADGAAEGRGRGDARSLASCDAGRLSSSDVQSVASPSRQED